VASYCFSYKQPIFVVIAARNYRHAVELAAGEGGSWTPLEDFPVHEGIDYSWFRQNERRGRHIAQALRRLTGASDAVGQFSPGRHKGGADRFSLGQRDD
jgi:hypothetical protein